MSTKKINNKANQSNANKGTNGSNQQYAKAVGNRGKQLNTTPNNANGGKK
ncbi:MAG: hypothetical protein V5789_04345 [Colwellia sp.]